MDAEGSNDCHSTDGPVALGKPIPCADRRPTSCGNTKYEASACQMTGRIGIRGPSYAHVMQGSGVLFEGKRVP